MKLYELHDIEILWEGTLGGEEYIFFTQQLEEGIRQTKFGQRKGGIVRGLANTALGMAKNPILAGLAVGYAYDAIQKYKKNKRTTTTFFAKDMQERALYKDIVSELVKTGKFKKTKEKYIDGGYLYVLKRV